MDNRTQAAIARDGVHHLYAISSLCYNPSAEYPPFQEPDCSPFQDTRISSLAQGRRAKMGNRQHG